MKYQNTVFYHLAIRDWLNGCKKTKMTAVSTERIPELVPLRACLFFFLSKL